MDEVHVDAECMACGIVFRVIAETDSDEFEDKQLVEFCPHCGSEDLILKGDG